MDSVDSTTNAFPGKRSHQIDYTKDRAARRFLLDEALALGYRLRQVQPFALTIPMVSAARLPLRAQQGIDQLLQTGKRELRQKLSQFIRLIRGSENPGPEDAQKAFAFLKLRFNTLLDQLDIFADVISQRSEHHTGVWLAGLDALADDALSLEPAGIKHPPLICYLDRGHGAAIRRVRTRLPGGQSNPVAVIRVPRERMVSNGIASSLVHEVGHQGADLLDLLAPMRMALRARANAADTAQAQAWRLFDRWISEIVSDFWAVATLGVGGTTGLMGVVSLPRYFMFRISLDDPHPFPWIRVKISLAFGRLLFPDEQWDRLEQLWNRFYPLAGLQEGQLSIIRELERSLPEFTHLVAGFRPAGLSRQSLNTIFPIAERQPDRLRQYFAEWEHRPNLIRKNRPALVFAVLGQARADHRVSPRLENTLLHDLLTHWAKQQAIIHS